MINPMDLTGRLALVTGASAGIGRETAIHISKLGAKVVLSARREDKLLEIMQQLEGDGHSYFSYDLNDLDGIETLIQTIVAQNGKLDGLVHCAGIAPVRPLGITKPKFVHEVMSVNFYSFTELARAVTKKKNSNDGASIVAMSSIGSLNGDKGKAIYAASKGAIDSAVRCIAHETADRKIRVNSIVAGFINTDMYKEYITAFGEEQYEKDIASKQYLGLGETVDIANAAAFLLSPASKFITGSGMVVDGGFLS